MNIIVSLILLSGLLLSVEAQIFHLWREEQKSDQEKFPQLPSSSVHSLRLFEQKSNDHTDNTTYPLVVSQIFDVMTEQQDDKKVLRRNTSEIGGLGDHQASFASTFSLNGNKQDPKLKWIKIIGEDQKFTKISVDDIVITDYELQNNGKLETIWFSIDGVDYVGNLSQNGKWNYTPVPEPASATIVAIMLIAFILFVKRRTNNKN